MRRNRQIRLKTAIFSAQEAGAVKILRSRLNITGVRPQAANVATHP
jgi:hypothetical protein